MTLCVAWIREISDSEELIIATDSTLMQELVFATDSALTGGEKWNHGVKLFELPRTDCLICFAGETYRAYPLILNLISTIKHNEELKNPALDIEDVLYGIVEIFTELVKSIFEKPSGDTSYIGGEAKFLFGGWSWKQSRFRIWRIDYSPDAEAFLPVEATADVQRSRFKVFIGDPEDEEKNIPLEAEKRYREMNYLQNKEDKKLDMEPMSILVDMCRDRTIREVDGAIQIGKVYKSGTTEFFGVMHPSIDGNPTFLGKIYDKHNKPRVRYFDPDSCQIVETDIPKSLVNIEDFSGTDDYDFLRDCYSQEDNFLKQNITDKERVRLISIFQERAYNDFKKKAEKNLNLEVPAAIEENGE